jgi:TatD DNase family protein
LRGVFHCFTGTAEQARQIVGFGGFYLGLGGVLTFKNSGLDEQIKDIPLDYMVLETDSPYLTPTPHRGKRNESKFIPLVAEKLANVKGCSLEEISEVTEQNASKLFRV